jgi:serpin B
LNAAFEALRDSLASAIAKSQKFGRPSESITLQVANRLFGKKGYEFRASFLALIKDHYDAALEQLDFANDALGAVGHINAWVEEQTNRRIRDLLPEEAVNTETRFVVVNAVYLNAPWAEKFAEDATKPTPFHVRGSATSKVPMMYRYGKLGYAKRNGFTAVTIPYGGGDLHFLVLMPDATNGLPALEAKISAGMLVDCQKIGMHDVILLLPKFKLELPTLSLAKELQALGMKTAFDLPPGSANFERLVARTPTDYLYVSAIFHKTFIAVHEKGTEAAGASAVLMAPGAAPGKRSQPVPIKVVVDRPFVFAIQHRPSGGCLFLGRVVDPR